MECSYTPTYADRTTQHDGRACVASNDSSTSTMSPTHLCTCSYTTTYDCLPQKAKVWCQHLIRARPTYSVVYMCRVATPRLLALTLARGSGPGPGSWPWPRLLALPRSPGAGFWPWRPSVTETLCSDNTGQMLVIPYIPNISQLISLSISQSIS